MENSSTKLKEIYLHRQSNKFTIDKFIEFVTDRVTCTSQLLDKGMDKESLVMDFVFHFLISYFTQEEMVMITSESCHLENTIKQIINIATEDHKFPFKVN